MTENQRLIQAYQTVRNKTVELCRPLAIEDYVIQSTEDVSPPKWHLAHTTWFFETFILLAHVPGYQQFDSSFQYLFNSYYQSLGNPFPRVKRGLLSRPTVETIYHYREYVDKQILEQSEQFSADIQALLTLGMHHEQQHQELLLMDIKHNFFLDPNFPVYQKKISPHTHANAVPAIFTPIEGGIIAMGHAGDGFSFDNELPRHQLIIQPYLLSTRMVTNAEYAEFIDAGGYVQPDWWLADGFEYVQKNAWEAPLYWQRRDNKWHIFTLRGLEELHLSEPVSHISYYEADAYARFRGARLPSEAEWEHCVISKQITADAGNFLESNLFHPRVACADQQFYGDLWEWTASPYCPYPGYQPLAGALGEYNGKFMSNQMVLRGGSCATSKAHIRASYRNFFQPDKRWQFSGIRLAKNV